MTTVRILPFDQADGAHNMAADETLLESAVRGTAALRFYRWSEPTVSLGYFQSHRVRQEEPSLAALPFVRRPTGGATLVHHLELTYALALPPSLLSSMKEPWLNRMHAIIGMALNSLGVPTRGHAAAASPHANRTLCFHQCAGGDLLIGPRKVVGSAQRKQRGALLQHGAILLARSPHTPTLPGILELTGQRLEPETLAIAIRAQWQRATGWDMTESDWTSEEIGRTQELCQTRYMQTAWNSKR